MRNPERIGKILELVRLLWWKNPDLRFGQIVPLIEKKYLEQEPGKDLFYVEDEELMKHLAELIND